jgi:hypothetical protein
MDISNDFASKEFGEGITEGDTSGIDVDMGKTIMERDVTNNNHGKHLKEHGEVRISKGERSDSV